MEVTTVQFPVWNKSFLSRPFWIYHCWWQRRICLAYFVTPPSISPPPTHPTTPPYPFKPDDLWQYSSPQGYAWPLQMLKFTCLKASYVPLDSSKMPHADPPFVCIAAKIRKPRVSTKPNIYIFSHSKKCTQSVTVNNSVHFFNSGNYQLAQLLYITWNN
jgi:hypothetical protein